MRNDNDCMFACKIEYIHKKNKIKKNVIVNWLTFVVHLKGRIPETDKNIQHFLLQILKTCWDVLIHAEAADLLVAVVLTDNVCFHCHRHCCEKQRVRANLWSVLRSRNSFFQHQEFRIYVWASYANEAEDQPISEASASPRGYVLRLCRSKVHVVLTLIMWVTIENRIDGFSDHLSSDMSLCREIPVRSLNEHYL